ncbi:MAG: SpoIIE family protein phosphatase [Crocinitomicaceae bacterium]|nr:SpoIIE family protein phosphatase [Crocinitomicaceae bacterium]
MGDFYWLEKSSDQILIAACDCTGHGVPGAMVSVICNNALNRSVREFGLKEPGKILDKTREIVISEFEKSEDEVKDGMDISLCALSISTLNLNWSGANNPLWILRKGSTEIEEIKADKQPIGKYAAAKSFTTHQKNLEKGDLIYLITDGYQDQFGGEKGKKFKASELKKLLVSISNESMDSQKKKIDEAFESWRGKLEQIDDVCIIGIRV